MMANSPEAPKEWVKELARTIPAVEREAPVAVRASENAARDLVAWTGLSSYVLAEAVRVPESTYANWLQIENTEGEVSTNVPRLRAVVAILSTMLSTDQVGQWLTIPIRKLDGLSPLALWHNKEEAVVEELVEQYADSIAS